MAVTSLSKLGERYYFGQRARLPIRKSTKPPANACGCEMIPIGTLNRSGDTVVTAKYLLSPFQTAIAAVTGELLAELRRPAGRSETGVIGAPYGVEKRLMPSPASHLIDARKRIEHES